MAVKPVKPTKDKSELEDNIVEAMMKIGRFLRSQKISPSMKQVESLTLPQLQMLRAIGNEKPTMAQLANEQDLSLPTVSVSIDKLVKAGYVERYDDPNDRRIVRVGLSKRGKQISEKLNKEKANAMRNLISQLDANDKKKMQEVMSTLLTLLDERSKN